MMDKSQRLLNNEMIYVDTSILMNASWLKKYLEINYLFLLENHLKIIVIREVMFELIKHLHSDSIRKQKLAKEAINLLKENIEVFEIECIQEIHLFNTNEYIFADPILLSRLLEKRINYRQILITNDKDLVFDALNLNKSASCFGYEVYVFELCKNGELINMTFEENGKADEFSKDNEFDYSQKDVLSNNNMRFSSIATFVLGGIVYKLGEYIWKEIKLNDRV